MSEATERFNPAPSRKLGRLPHDPVALASAPQLAGHPFAAAAPRAVVDRREVPFQPGLYHNDTLPDCTAVGLANAASAVAALNGFALAIVPDKVTAFYAGCVGCAPTFEAMEATPGAVALDVLNCQVTQGFDVGSQVPLVGLHGVLPHDRTTLACAIDRLGHAYLGVTLHERDMEQSPMWDVVDGRDDGKVVGGHLIVGWDYTGLTDDATLRLATWGKFQPATWRWLEARLNEAHALIWRQLGATSGEDLGVSVEALEAELARIRTA